MTDPILPALDEKRRRIQSIETGFGLLKVLVDSGQPMMLRDLATQAGMSSAKAHPYLVSFTNVGLVQQAPATGLYELGPFALQMGLVSLQSQNPVKIALPLVQAWASRIGHTLGLAVLGSHGPTMVHISEASYPVHVNMRCGTVMSMLHTATGHVFAAWLPRKWLATTLSAKRATVPLSPASARCAPAPTSWRPCWKKSASKVWPRHWATPSRYRCPVRPRVRSLWPDCAGLDQSGAQHAV